jgi:hypothetical protein
MRSLIISLLLTFICATSASAEGWTCTYLFSSGVQPTLIQFELSPPDLINTKLHEHYRILQNNDYGLVAVSSIAEIEQGKQQPTVGAATVVIDKGTGEFWLATAIAGQPSDVNQPVHGTCLKH